MSATTTPPKVLDPPFYDPPIVDYPSGQQHSQAWTEYHQSVSDQLATMTQQLATVMAGMGVTDGSNAAAGQIGEYMTGSASGVALSNAAVVNVASVALTPGDWDVSGNVGFTASSGTGHTLFGVGIGALDSYSAATFPTGAINQAMNTGVSRHNITSAATVWVVARADFTGGTVTASGTVRARRVR
jgi:hypothetical protein